MAEPDADRSQPHAMRRMDDAGRTDPHGIGDLERAQLRSVNASAKSGSGGTRARRVRRGGVPRQVDEWAPGCRLFRQGVTADGNLVVVGLFKGHLEHLIDQIDVFIERVQGVLEELKL
jgi:hypothetical protein